MSPTLIYVLLSPTFGMHQYTADLAHEALALGYDVHVVTTATFPRDRYAAAVQIHTPIDHTTTGFAPEGLRLEGAARIWRQILALRPTQVHFTGAHLWNPLLVAWLQARGITTIHTLHDLEPHPGVRLGWLIRLWNRLIVQAATRLLVHAERYRCRLAQRGVRQLYAWPLTHTFLSAQAEQVLDAAPPARSWEPWVLFFGRIEAYKGVELLLESVRGATPHPLETEPRAVLAGRGALDASQLPAGVLHLNQHIDDAMGWELFSRCRAVVLPYTGATQSALPAAAYAFGKPVIVSDSGALAESVDPGRTGWVTRAGDAPELARAIAEVRSRSPQELSSLGDAGRAWRASARARARQMMTAMYVGGSDSGGSEVRAA